MNSTSPPANVVDAIVSGLTQVLASGFEALAQLILAMLIAGPALATLALLWLEPRVNMLHQRKIANAFAAVILTVLGGYLFVLAATWLSETLDTERGFYAWVLPAALTLVAVALFAQWSARKTFSTVRATGVACAIATPLTLLALDAMF